MPIHTWLMAVLALLVGLGQANAEPTQWAPADGGNGHSYEVILDNQASWDEAKAAADLTGGHLVSIASDAENQFIASLLQEGGFSSGAYWIGLRETETEGDWVWDSGEPLDFTNWGPGEPNNSSGVENRGHLGWTSDDDKITHPEAWALRGVWNDLRNEGWLPWPYGWQPSLERAGYIVEFDDTDPLPCPFTVSDFEAPMGKKKKIGSTLPVKFQLIFEDIPIQSQEELNAALEASDRVPACPEISLFDVTDLANQCGIELPDDETNVGEGGDLGFCFRFADDGTCIYNLRLTNPPFLPDGSYEVQVRIGDCILKPGNGLFQTK